MYYIRPNQKLYKSKETDEIPIIKNRFGLVFVFIFLVFVLWFLVTLGDLFLR